MMRLWSPLAVIVMLGVIVCCGQAPARTWTDSAGKHKVEGEFVKLANGQVDIRCDDGKLVRIPLEKLSEADQRHVRELAKHADESPSPMAAEEAQSAAKPRATAAGGDTQAVFAEGVGTTEEEALKDAFRAAVRQVVGEVVDGETLVKNEELVKDQVLTYSDGFIPEHKVTSQKHDNGLFRVGIEAKVERRSVIMKLKAANITLKSFDGESLFGNIVTQVAAEKDAAALAAKALEGFPDHYLEAHVVGKPSIMEKTDTGATFGVFVRFSPSSDAYKGFASVLCRTFERISKNKGEFTSVAPETPGPRGRGPYYCVEPSAFTQTVAKWMPGLWQRDRNWGPKLRSNTFVVAVATLVPADPSRVDWKYYVLDEAVADAVLRPLSRHVTCKLALVDDNDQPISVDRFVPQNTRVPVFVPYEIRPLWGGEARRDFGGLYLWRCFLRVRYDGNLAAAMGDPSTEQKARSRGHAARQDTSANAAGMPRVVFIAPFFFGFGRRDGPSGLYYVPAFDECRQLKLSLDELRKVAKAKCELEFRARE